MSGLPESKGTTATRFATHAGEPGVIYAANNRGLFKSDDAGRGWRALDIPWPKPGLGDGVDPFLGHREPRLLGDLGHLIHERRGLIVIDNEVRRLGHLPALGVLADVLDQGGPALALAGAGLPLGRGNV